MKDSKKIKQIETKAPLKIDISKVTRQRQNKNEDLLSSVPKSEFLNEGKKWSFKDELPNKIDLKKIQSQFSAANPKSLDHSEIFKEDEKDDQQSLLNFKQEVSKLKSLHTSKTIGYSQVNKKKQSIQSANLHQQAKELKIQAQSPNTSSLQQISKTLQVNDSVQLLKSPKIIPLDFKTQQKIEMKKSIVGVDEMKSYQQFSKIEIIESKVDSNLDSDEEDEGEEEQESLYYSLNSSEEEQRREIERNKRKQKKLLKEKQKINANSQQKLSRKKIIQQESINLESYYSDEADLKKKAHIHNKEKFFIESLNQMENKNSLNHLEKQNDSFEDQLQEDNKFGDYSSLEYNESMYNEIQDGQKGKGVFGTKRKRLISDFKDLREGINKDDVEANDSFESYIEQQELNWTGDMTSKPRYKDREDRLRITPFASPKLNHFSSQITKYKDQGDTQSVQPPSQNEISLSKNKSLKKIYVRSIHKLVPEKAWEEKSFKLDVVEMSLEEGQSIKARLANKEILSDYGISVHSKKGNSQDNNHNMSDYFLYIDKNIKLISVIMGHGAYGNFISNLTCRLLFKHFFRESLIKLQPQIGFKRLFMNVDKFISQHIIYYELVIDQLQNKLKYTQLYKINMDITFNL